MEHRHGHRVAVAALVRIEFSSRALPGRMANVSLSGALIDLTARIPEHSWVDVVGIAGRSAAEQWRIPAVVVRHSGSGVAVEWDEFAPLPVLELLRPGASPGAGLAPPRRKPAGDVLIINDS